MVSLRSLVNATKSGWGLDHFGRDLAHSSFRQHNGVWCHFARHRVLYLRPLFFFFFFRNHASRLGRTRACFLPSQRGLTDTQTCMPGGCDGTRPRFVARGLPLTDIVWSSSEADLMCSQQTPMQVSVPKQCHECPQHATIISDGPSLSRGRKCAK